MCYLMLLLLHHYYIIFLRLFGIFVPLSTFLWRCVYVISILEGNVMAWCCNNVSKFYNQHDFYCSFSSLFQISGRQRCPHQGEEERQKLPRPGNREPAGPQRVSRKATGYRHVRHCQGWCPYSVPALWTRQSAYVGKKLWHSRTTIALLYLRFIVKRPCHFLLKLPFYDAHLIKSESCWQKIYFCSNYYSI